MVSETDLIDTSSGKELETHIIDVQEVKKGNNNPREDLFVIYVDGPDGYVNSLQAQDVSRESVLREHGVESLEGLKGKQVKVLYKDKTCVRIRPNN